MQNTIILAHGAVNDGDQEATNSPAVNTVVGDDMMAGEGEMPGGYMMAGGFVMLIVWALAVLGAVYLIKILMNLGDKQSKSTKNSNNTDHE